MTLSFRNVKKAFGPKAVLKGVTFDIEEGERFFIVGASGVGKSVLIKHVVGLLRPDSGQILLEGEDVAQLSEKDLYPVRKKCAMVFQGSTLFDSMTIRENVELPLRKHRKMSRDEIRAEADRRLGQVQMEDFADAYPPELGDGMRKRVAIARALTLEPRYVLFDEPTTSLDPVSARRVDAMIDRLAELGVTSVVVSHDLTSIFGVADRIAMLYKGRVRKIGTREEFRNTDDPVIGQFMRGEAEGPMEV